MKKFEKFAIVLIILWLVTALVFPFGMTAIVGLIEDNSRDISTTLKIITFVLSVCSVLVQLGVGFWLFREAKKKDQAKWVWLLFGLVFGIAALIFYYLDDIKKSLLQEEQTVDNTSVVDE